MKVGVDSSLQFNDTYMSWMANSLIKKFVMKYKSRLYNTQHFID
jgi:hypothetical protein